MDMVTVGIIIVVGFVLILIFAAAVVGKGCDRAVRMDEEDRFR
jgi:hypothetical protein